MSIKREPLCYLVGIKAVCHFPEEDEKADKFAQISTLIIFVVGMTVLAIVLYQFVLKKCKEDDLPPQRQGTATFSSWFN